MAKSDDVPWLDDDEQAAWLSLMGTLIRLPAALDAQLRRDAGLSHFEYQILAGLSMAERRTLRMSDLASFAESSLSRLSHACRRLEAQGWLTRQADPDDGRATVAALTDDGYAKVVEAAPGHVRTVRRLVFDPLTRAQVKQLGEVTARIDAAIGPRLLQPPQ
ncbi:MAG TPA: MarR family transcriptional regulator [Acidimicrobiales bacterium]|jgi:DNA-binding MarR family transcriptional regulator|nr:MarR family transcriptional regulator [Acidimicrobiales bacterium]